MLQRTSEASVKINQEIVGRIDEGLMVLLGIEEADDQKDIDWLTHKIINLRVFDDDHGVMNKSLLEVGGDVLLISQFTLHASTKKGNRPSYIKAGRPDIALPLYGQFIDKLEHQLGKGIQTGKFGADMKVNLINDGPVTLVIDSKNKQ